MKPSHRFPILTLILILGSCGGGGGGGGGEPGEFQPSLMFLAGTDKVSGLRIYGSDLAGQSVVTVLGPMGGQANVLNWTWSPDRRWMAFVADKDIAGVDELYVVPAAGGTPTKVHPALPAGRSVAHSIQWSNDSARIAFVGDLDTENVSELYVATPATGELRKVNGPLVPGGHVSFTSWAWSPDGSRIAYMADQQNDGQDQLYATPAPFVGGNVRLNGNLAVGGDVIEFVGWNADGSRVAYVADQVTDEVYELFTTEKAGADNVRVNEPLSAGGGVSNVQWAPDGSLLAYRAEDGVDVRVQLYTALPGGGGSVQVSDVTSTFGDVSSYAWSPDSSKIAYLADQEVDERLELYWALPIGLGGVEKVSGAVVSSAGRVHLFVWLLDSQRLAYLADPDVNGRREIFVTSLGTAPAYLKVSGPLVSGGGVGSFRLSPDGHSIAYTADQEIDGQVGLYRTPTIYAGQAVKVSGPPTSAPVQQYLWSSDSMTLLYLADADANGLRELYSGFEQATKLSAPLPSGFEVGAFVVR